MAPELAIDALGRLPRGATILDPMVGSGVVVRHASELGLNALGYDLDPLAVLMARVWTTPFKDSLVSELAAVVLEIARKDLERIVRLPWIDEDKETSEFVAFWFGEKQRLQLRSLAHVLMDLQNQQNTQELGHAIDILRLALSRIIITKDAGASLARDVSHSRPHRVKDVSSFEVIDSFERSVNRVRRLLSMTSPLGNVRVDLGDARILREVENQSVDVVVTSPPYLNAIDYMRGHRLALVWFGHRLSGLRAIRAESIGTERGSGLSTAAAIFDDITAAIIPEGHLSKRSVSIVNRYAEDTYRSMSQISRVLKLGGTAVLVIGDCWREGTLVRNADGFTKAGEMVGLRVLDRIERELPERRRYLPLKSSDRGPLSKRIRTESVVTFGH